MAEKITIEKIYISDKNKAGVAYIASNGKPYKRAAIKAVGNPNWVSTNVFYSNDPILNWKVGDIVEIIIEKRTGADGKEWLNFHLPKKEDAFLETLNRIEQKVDWIMGEFKKKELTPPDEQEEEIGSEEVSF